jgi:hypothetical protein
VTTLVAILCACQDGRCFYCGHEFSGPPRQGRGRRPSQWSKDHLWPKRAGGQSTRNIVLACNHCNTEKGDRVPTQDEVDRASVLFERVRKMGKIVVATDFWEERHWPKPMRPFSWPKEETPQPTAIAAALEAA